jgi:hypothetical protein
LQGICTSKLPPQGNEEKYVAQKMKQHAIVNVCCINASNPNGKIIIV